MMTEDMAMFQQKVNDAQYQDSTKVEVTRNFTLSHHISAERYLMEDKERLFSSIYDELIHSLKDYVVFTENYDPLNYLYNITAKIGVVTKYDNVKDIPDKDLDRLIKDTFKKYEQLNKERDQRIIDKLKTYVVTCGVDNRTRIENLQSLSKKYKINVDDNFKISVSIEINDYTEEAAKEFVKSYLESENVNIYSIRASRKKNDRSTV